MALDRLRSFLRSRRRIALDPSIFIYQLQMNPRYFPLTDTVFAWLERPGNSAVTSTLSMTELLVPAYRGNEHQIGTYYGLLKTFPGLTWIAPDLEIADLAARFCAVYRLRTPDAIHAATASNANARAFLTNDPIFQRIAGLESVVLDELL